MVLKRYTSLILGPLLCLASYNANCALLEDFAEGAINGGKYHDAGGSVELDGINQEIIIRANSRSFTGGYPRIRIRLQDSTASTLQADLNLIEYLLGNVETQNAFIGIGGFYYNAETASPTGDLGEVFARVAFGDLGDGLAAYYIISTGIDNEGNYEIVDIGNLDVPNLALDTFYTASVVFDGDRSFVFTFNGVSSGTIEGPIRVGDALFEQRRLDSGPTFGRVNATDDPNDTSVDDGSIASIEGRFDNVTTEDGMVDDFSSSTINQTVWRDGEFSREVENESLVLRAVGNDASTIRNSFRAGKRETDYLGATLTLLSSSTQNSSTRVQARIAGEWYNDTYSETDAGNGQEGDHWAALQIERVAGAMRATINIWREDPNHIDGGTDVDWQELTGSYEMDIPYEVAIERTETNLNFYIDSQLKYQFNITGNNYPVKGGTYKIVRAEKRSDAGEVYVRADDIITDYEPPALGLNATNSNEEQIELPTDTNVQEGETVTLTATVDNIADIDAFIWQQTAGPDVTINMASRIVGSDQSITFTVPDGSDGNTLGFTVTVVDQFGVDATLAFSFKVNNSQDSTLNDSSKSGSGSTSVSSLLLLTLLLVGLIKFGRYRL